MENRVLKVFYGTDLLPYKDVERTVHYPVGGSTFAGTNNTYQVHFYVDKIGGTGDISWVVVSKLPNGKLGYQPIAEVEIDSDLNENYLVFDLSSYYSQYKGVVKLALRGYQGNITFTEVESDVYEITGDPLIEVTGTIDLAINYSPFVNTSATLLPTEVDRILAALSQYLKIGNGIVALPNSSADISDYSVGQVFLNLQTGRFVYKQNASMTTLSQAYQYEFGSLMTQELNITEGSGEIWGTIESSQNGIQITTINGGEYIVNENGIYDTANGTYIATEDYVGTNTFKKVYFAGTNTLNDIYSEISTEPASLKNTTTNEWYLIQFNSHSSLQSNVSLIKIDGSLKRINGNFNNTTTLSTVLNSSNDPYATEAWSNGQFANGFVLDLSEEQGISGTLDQDDYYRLVNDNTAFIIYKEHLYVRNSSDGVEADFYCLSIGDDLSLYNEEIYVDATYHWYYDNYSNGSILATQDWVADEYYDKDDIDSMLSSTYNYIGTKTVAEINALNTSTLHKGDVYNVSDSGTITLGSVAVVAGDNIAWTGSAWDKLAGTIDTSIFVQKTNSANKIYATDDSGSQTTIGVDYGSTFDGVIARRSSGGWLEVPLTPITNGQATSKKYVDDSIANVKLDNYKYVNLTTYPTLDDFLASTGVQGTMYLYPVDTSYLTKGYYKYIYEITWQNLGTTKVDLSNYYTKSETIAQITLNQTRTVVVANATTNLNGYPSSNNHYTAVDSTVSSAVIKLIKYDNDTCSREQAINYMYFMTGSKHLPEYNYEHPQNCLFIFADGTIWKPQYDSTNGMVLWKLPDIYYRRNADLVPDANGTRSIGSSSYKFDSAYINHIYMGTYGASIFTNYSELSIGSDSDHPGAILLNGDTVSLRGSVLPQTNYMASEQTLGSYSRCWYEIYTTYIKDGEGNAFTVAEGMAQFNPTTTGSTEIKWSQMLTFSLSADTTLTFETAKTNCLNEYKAIITNSGASAITLTFTGISNILCNDDNCVISNGTNSTLQVPSGTTIEVNAVNGKLIAVNFEAQ